MKKLFISQPMNGKSDEEIQKERELAIIMARQELLEDVEVIDTFYTDFPPDAKPLEYLGRSIMDLSKADVAYFAPGWSDARGCKIEHECAVEYGIDRIEPMKRGMPFRQALEAMKQGCKVKMPNWSGYWCIENGSIKMNCKDGKVLDIRETEDLFYTLGFITSNEWVIADETNSRVMQGEFTHTFNFGEAIRNLKNGKRVARSGWNGRGMFVVYQKGYPQGIPCNKQTAEAWGMNEGELFQCEPYLQIKMVNGSHAMWVPSINDVLAEDWELVE